jgi:homoaconitase/3-isopropylmalate dehydratase large subunit
MILKLISLIGIGGGNGHIFEYTGTAIADLSMEARMSICNMSIEAGARGGLISPDEKTIEYLKTRKITTKISSGDLDRIIEELRLPLKIHGQAHTKASVISQQLILRLLNLGRKFILISSYPQSKALLEQINDSAIAWVQDLSALSSNLDKPMIWFEGSLLDNIQSILAQIEPDRIVAVLDLENLSINKNLTDLKQLELSFQPLLTRRNLLLAGDWTNLEWLNFEFNSELQFSPYKNQLMPELSDYEVLWTLCEPKPFRPKEEDWDKAVEYWLSLRSDPGCEYDRELVIDVSQLEPMITWGTNPGEGIPITGTVPYLDELPADSRNNAKKSLEYTKLQEGQKLLGLPVDFVFMGSCTNSRIEDLRIVAKILQGKKVAKGVTMYVVPGSEAVRKQAELEGLDQIFKEAGAEWRMPGCSMCLGMNDDKVPAGKRCVATSNRNFMNRQGPGAITHLASPATAAATAITGVITDPRTVL